MSEVKKSIVIKPVIVEIVGVKDKQFTLSNAMRHIGYVYTKEMTDKAKEEWHKPWRSTRAALLKVTKENPTVKVVGFTDKKTYEFKPV